MLRTGVMIAGAVLAVGLAASGYFVGDGLRSMKNNNRYVVVRGLSEREVMADTARLVIKTELSGASPAEIFPKLTNAQKQIVSFLHDQGLKPQDIVIGQWSTLRTGAEDLKNDPSLPLYNVEGSIVVTTSNVAAIEKTYRKMNDLRVATDNVARGGDVAYSFTGIAPLRAEMIAAATKDARNAALQFASDSGSRVGSINNASQGVFQILAAGQDSDNSESIHKVVRVVTTINYELKD